MYELETDAGTVFSMSESLADALAECLQAEQQSRTEDFYEAIETGLSDAPIAQVVQFPHRGVA